MSLPCTAWLTQIQSNIPPQGMATLINKSGRHFALEWMKVSLLSAEISHFKSELLAFAIDRLTQGELTFLKAHPEASSTELFLRAAQPLITNNSIDIDWAEVKRSIQSSIEQFYLADLSKFDAKLIAPLLHDAYFCAKIKDGTGVILGYLLFSITPAMPYGHVKVINFFTQEQENSSEVASALMSLIFKILPDTRHIFLFIRPTDTTALNIYASIGFAENLPAFSDPNHQLSERYWSSLEYNVDSSSFLQNIATNMESATCTF